MGSSLHTNEDLAKFPRNIFLFLHPPPPPLDLIVFTQEYQQTGWNNSLWIIFVMQSPNIIFLCFEQKGSFSAAWYLPNPRGRGKKWLTHLFYVFHEIVIIFFHDKKAAVSLKLIAELFMTQRSLSSFFVMTSYCF